MASGRGGAVGEQSSVGHSEPFDRDKWIAFSLEHHSDLDVIDNLATRPPDGEFVLTLCANVADAYVGSQVATFSEHLGNVNWSDPENNPPLAIQRAIDERNTSWGNFRLLPIGVRADPLYQPAGYCDLPQGVSEIYVSYVLVTPKLVLLSTTFVLDKLMSGFLQDALMTDAKSRFEVMEDRIVQGSLDFAKRRVISNGREHLRTEIFAWVQSHYGAGSLARAKRLKNPFCVLASMHGEISFTHAPRYMRLLDINPVSIAFESDSDPGFYFVYPRTFNTPSEMWAFTSDNETQDVAGQKARENIPFKFHGLVAPITMVEAVRLGLDDLSIQTELAGDSLDDLSLERGQDAQIPQLRAIQLDLAVRLSRFCDGVDELATEHFLLWNEYPKLKAVGGSINSDFIPTPANQKQALSRLTEQVRSQERSLRNLVSITSAAIVDRDMVGITRNLKTLTKWLAFLTCLSVAISLVALVISATN